MKWHKLLALVAALLIVSLAVPYGGVQPTSAASSTDWLQFQGDEVNSGKTSDHAPTTYPAMTWSQFTYQGGAIGIEVAPIIAGDMVYVYAGDGLWAFDKRTGETRWQTSLTGHGGLQTSTPAYGDSKIFIATFDGYLFAFDALTGDELWGKEVSQHGFQCPITYHEQEIYVGEGGTGGETNSYYCLDVDGNILWKYTASTAGYLWCGASVIGGYLVFGNVDGVLTSVNKNNGSLVDELDLKDLRPNAGRIRASVAYHDGYVYTTSESSWDVGYIWKVGFDPATGNFLDQGWSVPIGFSTSTPVVYQGKVYVGQGEHGCPGSLICLDDVTGEVTWSYPVTQGVKASPALSLLEEGSYIYFTIAQTDGLVYCLRDDGTLAWEWDPPDEGYILQGVAISDGAVFLGTSGGYLYCLEEPAETGSWSQFQKDEVNSGKTSATAPVSSPRVAWSAFTHYSSTHGIDVTPIVANGKVFVIDVDEYAWAFDATSGNVLWSTPLATGPRFTLATPAYGEGKVFFATDTGYIYALDESVGEILWSGKLTEGTGQDEEIATQIVYADGKVYVGSWEGVYYCLDASGDGTDPKILWSYDVKGKRYSWWSGPAVIGDFLLFGDTDSVIVSVNKDSGDLADELNLSDQYGITAGWIRSAITANESQNRIYLTSTNGYLFTIGFDTMTGEFNPSDGWFTSIDSYSASTPAVYGGRVYVCSGSFCKAGGLYCFEESTGTPLWSYPFGTYGSEASPALSLQDGEPYIYITTDTANGAAYCFDKDRNVMWQYVPDHPEYILQGVAIAEGKVFFGNDAGYLYALGPCPDWDVNCDGSVNIMDVVLVGTHWGEIGTPGWIREDVNDDGEVNIQDVAIVGMHWTG